jgi:hypothetical protein
MRLPCRSAEQESVVGLDVSPMGTCQRSEPDGVHQPVQKDFQNGFRQIRVGMVLGHIQTEKKKSIQGTVESNGQAKGIDYFLKLFLLDCAANERGKSFKEGVMSFTHLLMEARLEVEARTGSLSDKKADQGKILLKPFALNPEVIS